MGTCTCTRRTCHYMYVYMCTACTCHMVEQHRVLNYSVMCESVEYGPRPSPIRTVSLSVHLWQNMDLMLPLTAKSLSLTFSKITNRRSMDLSKLDKLFPIEEKRETNYNALLIDSSGNYKMWVGIEAVYRNCNSLFFLLLINSLAPPQWY